MQCYQKRRHVAYFVILSISTVFSRLKQLDLASRIDKFLASFALKIRQIFGEIIFLLFYVVNLMHFFAQAYDLKYFKSCSYKVGGFYMVRILYGENFEPGEFCAGIM